MVQTYSKGSTIFHHNEAADNLYALIRGDLELSIIFTEEIITKKIKHEEYIQTKKQILERPIVIETVNDNEIFGWSALVEPWLMTATATCISDAKIAFFPASGLRQLFSRDPELGYIISTRLTGLIASRLHNRTEKLVDAWCTMFKTPEPIESD